MNIENFNLVKRYMSEIDNLKSDIYSLNFVLKNLSAHKNYKAFIKVGDHNSGNNVKISMSLDQSIKFIEKELYIKNNLIKKLENEIKTL